LRFSAGFLSFKSDKMHFGFWNIILCILNNKKLTLVNSVAYRNKQHNILQIKKCWRKERTVREGGRGCEGWLYDATGVFVGARCKLPRTRSGALPAKKNQKIFAGGEVRAASAGEPPVGAPGIRRGAGSGSRPLTPGRLNAAGGTPYADKALCQDLCNRRTYGLHSRNRGLQQYSVLEFVLEVVTEIEPT